MTMKIGITGKPLTGKTALFQALTQGQVQPSFTKEPLHGVVTVPDPRFDYLVGLYNPKKITPATIEFIDDAVRFSEERGREFSDSAMAELRNCDAIIYVINAFQDATPDAAAVKSEAAGFLEELAFRDLMVLENRIERVVKQVKAPNAPPALKSEYDLLLRLKSLMESGERLEVSSLSDVEARLVAGFQLLTVKPSVIAVNVAEESAASAEGELSDTISYLQERNIPVFCLSAEIEKQISELEAQDQEEFLSALGLTEPVRGKLIRQIYTTCNLMTFFTVGEKEVHAWPIPKGSTALEAADSIHSDLARGFIRSEVISYTDIQEAGGWDEAKAAGKMLLVGKEHVIQDGDCLYIRFKV